MRLLIGTNNAGKVDEVRAALDGLPLQIITPSTIGMRISPDEIGNTYTENAL
ncbi:non-canonical purine NTP pyrophosphatase, partial [Candidatus Peregrinibacteria bacterium]|nr:non-canonical purine NTP pyrophosphatase [Candidatus Peregrinibacteria bacterium]